MANPVNRALATNRRARHEYHILETMEAGISLLGTEVKSVRAGKDQLKESFVDEILKAAKDAPF